MLRVQGLRVESDGPVAYQLDGDAGGALPLEIDVLSGRARLIVPEAWAKLNANSIEKSQHSSTTQRQV
jgi:diacylglycerol kinase family enzyme